MQVFYDSFQAESGWNEVALNGGLTLHAWWSTLSAASAHTSHRTQYSWIPNINVPILVWCHRQPWQHGSDSTVQSLTQRCYARYTHSKEWAIIVHLTTIPNL